MLMKNSTGTEKGQKVNAHLKDQFVVYVLFFP